MKYTEVSDYEEENERVRRPRADMTYKEVFRLFGRPYPLNWNIRPVEIEAARNLLTERGMEQIKEAIQFIKDFGDRKIGVRECPQIFSPYDLDSKWSKLEAFSKKLEKIL